MNTNLQKKIQDEIQTFYLKLKKLSEKKGVSMLQLSEQTGIPLPILLELENCKMPNNFDVAMFFDLCRFFSIEPRDFFLKDVE